MKISIVSDLHLNLNNPPPKLDKDQLGDVLIVAGDTHQDTMGIEYLMSFDLPLIAIGGNHEYGRTLAYSEVIREHQDAFRGTSAVFLENEKVTIDNVNFFGCCLWTDLSIHDDIDAAKKQLNEKFIRNDVTGISVNEIIERHRESRYWLEKNLKQHKDQINVVITHFPPVRQSLSPEYQNHPVKGYYNANCPELIEFFNMKAWVSGHSHEQYDYWLFGTRMISNAHGVIGLDAPKNFSIKNIVI